MQIVNSAIAGTLESSDAQVTVEPAPDGLDVEIQSTVMNQYGRQIKATVLAVLDRLEITSGKIIVIDKGALDCTLMARVECAALRSNAASQRDVPWGGAIR